MTVLHRNFRAMSLAVSGVAALQYVLYFLVARLLGSDDYGAFALALTMALLAAPLCDLGTSVALVWSAGREPERLAETAGTSLALRFLLMLPVGALAMLLASLWGYPETAVLLFVPLFLATVLDGAGALCSAVFQAREAMGYSALILLSRNLTRAAGLSLALVFGDHGLWSVCWCWLGASALHATGCVLLVLRHLPLRVSRPAMLPTLRCALPFGVAVLGNLLLLQSDVLMLGWLGTAAEVGPYHAAFRFVVLAELLPYIISTVVLPRAYRVGRHEGAAALGHLYRVQTVLLGPLGAVLSLGLALHGEDLIAQTLGAGFAAGGPILLALSPLVFLRFMLVPLGDAATSLGRQRTLASATWLALGCNLVWNAVAIPRFGALGAAMATVLSQTVMLAVLWRAVRGGGVAVEWARILGPALAACALVAAAGLLLPGLAACLLPVGIATLAVLIGTVPAPEHRSLLRTVPRLFGGGRLRRP